MAYCAECFEVNDSIMGPEAPETLSMLRKLAKLLVDARRYEDAEEHLRLLHSRFESALGPAHERTLETLGTHAGVLWQLGRREEAQAALELLLAGRELELKGSPGAQAEGGIHDLHSYQRNDFG